MISLSARGRIAVMHQQLTQHRIIISSLRYEVESGLDYDLGSKEALDQWSSLDDAWHYGNNAINVLDRLL